MIEWNKVRHFGPHEWPEGVLSRVNPELIYCLDHLRFLSGHPIYPSPLPSAWARDSGSKTSRHYAVGRKSDAGDVFPDANIADVFLVALGSKKFGGVGVYFDTEYQNRHWPMLHVDLRPRSEIWCRVDGEYHYPLRGGNDRQVFWKKLFDQTE